MVLSNLVKLAVSFGKIGIFSFGGGNSMLFLIEDECVRKHQWLSSQDYSSMMGMSFLFPGLTAVKVAGTIGYDVAGFPGLIVSLLAINLPGLMLMLGCYAILSANKDNPYVAKTVKAMQYAAVVMISAVVYSFILELGKNSVSSLALILSVAYFLMIAIFNLNATLSLIAFMFAFVLLA